MRVISGSSNPSLARRLSHLLGAPLANVEISKFPNGEKRVWVRDDLTDQEIILLQSFSQPVDEHIIELALLSDACKHLDAKKIIAVVPWLGYSPQDKSFRRGEPVSVHVVARIVETMGVDQVLTVDIHSTESLNFFTIPITEVPSTPVFINYLKKSDLANHVVVSVDKGSLSRCQKAAVALNLPLCVFDKYRNLQSGRVTLKHLSGSVKNKHVVGFDDFVSTGSTRIQASQILKKMGALSYTDCITHPLLAGETTNKLEQSSIDRFIFTDTYPIPKSKMSKKYTIVSMAPSLARTVTALLVD